jgi:sporulation protein YlmC with PRC-barrel domain
MAEPVAWKVIERGWAVYDSAGERVGTIDQIVGDTEADIFDGIAIDDSVFGPKKYVPSENVGRIEDGSVHLTIPGDRIATLDAMRAAPQEQILDESSTWYQRLAWWLTGRNR